MNQASNNDLIQHFTDHGVDIQIAEMVKSELESIFQNKFTRAMLELCNMDMLNGLDLDPTTRERIQQALAANAANPTLSGDDSPKTSPTKRSSSSSSSSSSSAKQEEVSLSSANKKFKKDDDLNYEPYLLECNRSDTKFGFETRYVTVGDKGFLTTTSDINEAKTFFCHSQTGEIQNLRIGINTISNKSEKPKFLEHANGEAVFVTELSNTASKQKNKAGLVVIQVQSTGCYLSVRSTKSITAGAQYPRKWEQFILLPSTCNDDSSEDDSSDDDNDDNDGSKGGTVF